VSRRCEHDGARARRVLTASSLTGLLSFMLSDEMTTGGISTNDADKRAYAAKSHAWNLEQRKFREAFPDVRPFFSTLLPR
jgi:ubiquitin-conjugating enzyme E2 J2